jgi:hypothetical protein
MTPPATTVTWVRPDHHDGPTGGPSVATATGSVASSGPTVSACECQGHLLKQNVGLHVASTFITISDFSLVSATESLDNFDSQLEEQHEW